MGAFLSPQPNHGGEVAQVNNAMQRLQRSNPCMWIHITHIHMNTNTHAHTHTFGFCRGPAEVTAGLPLVQRSYLGALLPESLLHMLETYGPAVFAAGGCSSSSSSCL